MPITNMLLCKLYLFSDASYEAGFDGSIKFFSKPTNIRENSNGGSLSVIGTTYDCD